MYIYIYIYMCIYIYIYIYVYIFHFAYKLPKVKTFGGCYGSCVNGRMITRPGVQFRYAVLLPNFYIIGISAIPLRGPPICWHFGSL